MTKRKRSNRHRAQDGNSYLIYFTATVYEDSPEGLRCLRHAALGPEGLVLQRSDGDALVDDYNKDIRLPEKDLRQIVLMMVTKIAQDAENAGGA